MPQLAESLSSRRTVLKTLAVAGAAASLPGLIGQTARPKRGRIDVHHHHSLPNPGRKGGAAWSPQIALENMDKFAIETSLLSLTQQADQLYDGTEKGRALARSINEYGAKVVSEHPGKF